MQEKFAAEVNSKSDFYEILGVERTATEDQLKKAYRKVSSPPWLEKLMMTIAAKRPLVFLDAYRFVVMDP